MCDNNDRCARSTEPIAVSMCSWTLYHKINNNFHIHNFHINNFYNFYNFYINNFSRDDNFGVNYDFDSSDDYNNHKRYNFCHNNCACMS